MNLDDFRTRTARVIGMSPTASADLALIDSWVNEAVIQFLKDTKSTVLMASLSVTAGSGDYTLDSDILALTDLWYEPAGGQQEVLLEPIDSRELQRMRLFQSAADIGPRYYSMQGQNLLMLHPLPESSSDLLHILYVPRPSATISATADSPEDSTRGNIPSEYHTVLESYVKWKAGEAEEHKPSDYGLKFQAEYERGVGRTKVDINKKSGTFLPRKQWGRRVRYPTSPGVDVR